MAVSTVFTALFGFLFIFLAQNLFRKWQLLKRERLLGCMRPNQYPHRLPWGIDLFLARMKGVESGRLNRVNAELFEKYGATYEEHLFGDRSINTREIENIQTIAALKFDDYGKSDSRTNSLLPFLGRGIFSEDGATWKHSRDLVKPLFKRAEISDIDGFRKHADKFINLIPRDGSTIDLKPWLGKLFLDSSTEFIFGQSLNTLDDTSGSSEEFLDAFNDALIGAGKRANIGNGKLGFLFKLEDKQWLAQCAKLHAFIDKHVQRALADAEDGSKVDDEESKHYILIDEMVKQTKDPLVLRFELLNVFFPARETTAIALSNALFHLARNPAVWAKLREQALPLKDTSLTFETVRSLPFFRYTLLEGIRLQGPSGRFQRVALRDTQLPRGGGPDGSFPVFVPKGTLVVVNNFPIFHDPEIWGEDVEEFRPSRFEGKVLTWEFTPFFGGPRICPAQQQVLTQGVYLLLRLVLEFEVMENRDPCLEYVELIKMLCESKNGVQVAFPPAQRT